MELVYLWIDKELYIEDASLNFSNRFHVTFSRDSKKKRCQLVVSPNDTHIPDFYGKNISNISAIVGANGSGKTSLIEILISLLSNQLHIRYFVSCFYDSATNTIRTVHNLFSTRKTKIIGKWDVKISTSIPDLNLERPQEVEVSFNFIHQHVNGYSIPFLKNKGVIYYSPAFDLRGYPDSVHNQKDYIDVSTNNLVYEDSREKNDSENFDQIERHRLKNTRRQFEFLQDKRFKLGDLQLPESIEVRYLKSRAFERNLSIGDRSLYEKIQQAGNRSFSKIHSLIDRAKSLDSNQTARLEKVKLWFVINLVDNFFSNLSILGDLDSDLGVDFDSLKDDDFINFSIIFFETQNWIEKSKFDFSRYIARIFQIIDDYAERSGQIADNDSHFFIEVDKALELHDWDLKLRNAFREGIGKHNRKSYGFLEFNWRDMSTGEKAYLDLFSRIFYGYRRLTSNIADYYFSEGEEMFPFEEKNIDYLYILLDEPELGLHPKWQRMLVFKLVEYLKLLTNIKIQVILTSHSPFVLSDIPKSNVVFVSRGLDQPIKISSFDSHQETFGSNIHDLFADGFFLNEKLVGDFALAFINSLVESINKAKVHGVNSLEAELIEKKIRIIGEPIIRTKLEEMAYSISPRQNEDDEMAELERRLEELRMKRNQGNASD